MLVCLMILSVFIGGTGPTSIVYANVVTKSDAVPLESTEPVQQVISAFVDLPAETKLQNIIIGDDAGNIVLPETLTGSLTTGEETTITPVSWTIDHPFGNMAVDTFIYTAVLPEPFVCGEGTVPPTITVKVNKATTAVLDLLLSKTKTASGNIYDTIQIHPAYGRVVYLQKYNVSLKKWETKSTYTLSNIASQTLTLCYPKLWYTLNEVTTSWRVYAPASATGTGYVSPTITIKALRAYQNPSTYYQLLPSVALRSNAGYTLRYGSMGLKVAMVQRKLGMGYIWEIIGQTTYDKIKAYQRSLGLTQTGNVDYSLWKRMGFSDYDWYYKGAYVSPMLTNLGSSRSQHIEAFISNAYRYLGTEYIVGASGKPKTGVDCSGLVMQSMYATGVDPYPISVIRHSQPGYEYESRNFWASTQLKTIPVKDRARGDLIFYQNRSGIVIHVAIYLGNNKVIESVPSGVRIADWLSYPNVKGVKRVFN